MAVNEPRALYHVTGTATEMIRQPDGSYGHAYRVNFRTALGQESYVIVPRGDDFDNAAHAAVQEEASRLVNMMNRTNIPLHTGQHRG